MKLHELEQRVDALSKSVPSNKDFYARKENFVKALRSPLHALHIESLLHARWAVERGGMSCEQVWTLAYLAFTE